MYIYYSMLNIFKYIIQILYIIQIYLFPWWLSGKEPACQYRVCGDVGSRYMYMYVHVYMYTYIYMYICIYLNLVLPLPASARDSGDEGLVPGWGGYPGVGGVGRLQCTCLEGSTDGGTWQGAKSRTQLSTHTKTNKK